jgi:transcriptional regulator with XRE-family HTH domain
MIKSISTFGEHLRVLRVDAGLTLREVALTLSIDNSLLAKIERDERQPSRQFIKQIASFYKVEEKELQNEYLSDQIANKIIVEEADLDILKVAEKKVSYLKKTHHV